MATMSGAKAVTLLSEFQEDRLTRVEDTANDTKTAVAVCDQKIETLGDRMEENNARLSAQMERGFEQISSQFKPLQDQVQALSAKLNSTDTVVTTLKAEHSKKISREKWVRNSGLGLLLTSMSAVAGAAGKYVWDALIK